MDDPGRKARLRGQRGLRPPAVMTAAEIEAVGRLAQARLISEFLPVGGGRVAIYAPIPGEVGTVDIASAVRRSGGTVFYPLISKAGEMDFFPVESEDALVSGVFGIPAPPPIGGQCGVRDGFSLVVVPGLAFDRSGYRLGRGGGYYDRFLSRPVADRVVGLAFSWQIVDEVPRDPWDIPVDAVVTEKGVIRVRPATGTARA
jgi:5-formyltetrahydrofolate cyclo-ligase